MKKPTSVADLPTWNYDGSSTGQAPGDDSEVYLVPRAMYKDPFRGGDNILVMCDCYEPPKVKPDGTVQNPVPIPTNTRAACAAAMEKAKDEVRAIFANYFDFATLDDGRICPCEGLLWRGLI
jgi:glutamine synthetase